MTSSAIARNVSLACVDSKYVQQKMILRFQVITSSFYKEWNSDMIMHIFSLLYFQLFEHFLTGGSRVFFPGPFSPKSMQLHQFCHSEDVCALLHSKQTVAISPMCYLLQAVGLWSSNFYKVKGQKSLLEEEGQCYSPWTALQVLLCIDWK